MNCWQKNKAEVVASCILPGRIASNNVHNCGYVPVSVYYVDLIWLELSAWPEYYVHVMRRFEEIVSALEPILASQIPSLALIFDSLRRCFVRACSRRLAGESKEHESPNMLTHISLSPAFNRHCFGHALTPLFAVVVFRSHLVLNLSVGKRTI
jgi:hypothetical protein